MYIGAKPRPKCFIPSTQIWLLDALHVVGRTIYGDRWTGKEIDVASRRDVKLRQVRIERELKRSEYRSLVPPPTMEEWAASRGFELGGRAFRVFNEYDEEIDPDAWLKNDPSAALRSIDGTFASLPSLTDAPSIEWRYRQFLAMQRLLPEPDDDAVERRSKAWGTLRDALATGRLRAHILDARTGKFLALGPETWRTWLRNEWDLLEGYADKGITDPIVLDKAQFTNWVESLDSAVAGSASVGNRRGVTSAPITVTNVGQSAPSEKRQPGRRPAIDVSHSVDVHQLFDNARPKLTFKRGEFTWLSDQIAEQVGLKTNTVQKKIRLDYREARKKARLKPD